MIHLQTALGNMLWEAKKSHHDDLLWYFDRRTECQLAEEIGFDRLRDGDCLSEYRKIGVNFISKTARHGFCAILGDAETTWALGLTPDGEIRKFPCA